MNYSDDPFTAAPDDVIEVLAGATRKLKEADALIAEMETSQKELMVHLDRLVDVIDAMQIKRDTWKFRADEMEIERNRWQAKYEEAECSLRMVRRRAAELAYRLGELHCPNCGSENLALLHGIFDSGVTAPDGGKEMHYECALDCQECGHKEELAP